MTNSVALPLSEKICDEKDFALPRRPRVNQCGEAEPTHGRQDGLHVPVGSRAILDGLEQLAGRHHGLALEDLPQDGDGRCRQLREVGQRASLDFAVLAIAFTKEDRGRRVAIGDGGDVQANRL